MKKYFFVVLIFMNPAIVSCQTGSLDSSFGSGGIVITDFSSEDDGVRAMTLQPDGKIVLVGYSNLSGQRYCALARYHPDGTLDNVFGTDRMVSSFLGSSYEYLSSVAIQPDGKLIVGGFLGGPWINTGVLARYLDDGVLDTSFGDEGKVVIDQNYVTALSLQPDGKILVVCGDLRRFNPDGTLDLSFNDDGITETVGFFQAMALQTDGKILLGGIYFSPGSDADFAVARYQTNGSLDSSFGSNGVAITDYGCTYDNLSSISIQEDGKIVVAGSTCSDFALGRYNVDGSLDSSFAQEGKLITSVGPFNDHVESVLIQQDGKIIAIGFTVNNQYTEDIGVVRYNPDGSLDSTFATAGKVITPIGPNSDRAYSAVLQNNGDLLVSGYASSTSNGYDFAVLRYLNDLNMPVDNLEKTYPFIYPNPFKRNAILKFFLMHQGEVSINLLNLGGKEVYNFIQNTQYPAGYNSQQLTLPAIFSSGPYLIRIQTPESVESTLVIIE